MYVHTYIELIDPSIISVSVSLCGRDSDRDRGRDTRVQRARKDTM